MKAIFSLLSALLVFQCFGQKQTFDIITYTPPKAWKKESTESAIQFTKQDDAKGTYCIITIMKSLSSGGSSKENFDAAWETVVKEMVKPSSAPEMQPVAKEDGWEAQSGHAPFQTDELNGVAVLVTTTGYQKMVNILILTNTDVYEKEMTDFFESASFKKPALENNDSQNNNTGNMQTNTEIKRDGFTYFTTNFDDGWKSEIKDDYVEVAKDNIKVYLSYPQAYNASDFSGTGKQARHFYWDNYVSKYFTTGEMRYNPGGALSDYSDDYIEGLATDKQTNEKRYIAMILTCSPNIVNVILASAPNSEQLRKQFPKADYKFNNDLKPMYSYNKFAIGKNDLTGTWVNGGNGAMLTWYSTTTGNNVGSTAVAKSDVFRFNTGNSYSSTHNGATGWVGSMNTYQQEYKGTYTVTDWTVTATKRWDGKTEKFDAWFEVIRGGRVLHLNTPGITYTLFKEK